MKYFLAYNGNVVSYYQSIKAANLAGQKLAIKNNSSEYIGIGRERQKNGAKVYVMFHLDWN